MNARRNALSPRDTTAHSLWDSEYRHLLQGQGLKEGWYQFRRKVTLSVCAGAAAIQILSGCGPFESSFRDSGPVLTELDTLILAESDTLSLGRPVALQLGSNGDVYVADAFHQRVIKFNARGSPVRLYGGKGDGEGEIRQLFSIVVIADSVLLAFDQGRQRANVFSAKGGQFIMAMPYVGIAGYGTGYADSAYVGVFSPRRRTAIAMWQLGADSLSYAGYLPKEYLSAPALAGIHSFVSVAHSDRGTVAGYSGVDSVVGYSPTWEAVEAGVVPASKRRGRPTDLVGFFNKRRPFKDLIESVSSLDALGVLRTGTIAVLHMDLKLGDTDGSMTGSPFVGLLSANLGSSCGEFRLKVQSDLRPIGAFNADTLGVLLRTVGKGGRPKSVLRRWIVSDSGCQWR